MRKFELFVTLLRAQEVRDAAAPLSNVSYKSVTSQLQVSYKSCMVSSASLLGLFCLYREYFSESVSPASPRQSTPPFCTNFFFFKGKLGSACDVSFIVKSENANREVLCV
jgi:hypothetical protein